jgi:nicotinamidase-related amidase
MMPITPNELETPAARRTLKPDDCALVVIDIQEKLLPPIFNRDQLVRNSQLLVRLAGILGLPVFATTQYAKGLGNTVPEILSLLTNVTIHDKLEFSCFGCGAFTEDVKSLAASRNTLLVCGMEAHICNMQTVLGALTRGYLVHVAADAIGSRTQSNWEVGLKRMGNAGAVISSTEMMMYELMRASGTAVFKEMLKHLK